MLRSGRGRLGRVTILLALAAPFGLTPAGVRQAGSATLYPEGNPDSALAVALSRIEGQPLSLQEAMRLASGSTTAVREAEAALRAAANAVRREKGAFDPSIFGGGHRASDVRPAVSPFEGTPLLRIKQTTGSAGGAIRLPLGTEIEASLNATKSETNSTFATLNPEYDAFGLVSIRLPLLAGFGPASRARLSTAERLRDAAQARYEDAVFAESAGIEETYWDLYATERDYAVRQLILEQANALQRETQVRAGAGMVGPNQVANAKVFVAEQEQALLDSEEMLDRVSDRMASLLGVRPESESRRFRPTDEPPGSVKLEPADSVVARALRDNKTLRSSDAEIAALRAQVRGAVWNAMPALDLFGSLGGNGLAGTGKDVIFGSDTLRTAIAGGLSDTFDDVLGRDFPTWSAGVRVSIPIGFRAGTATGPAAGGDVTRRAASNRNVAHDRGAVRAAYRELEALVASPRRGAKRGERVPRTGSNRSRGVQEQPFNGVRAGPTGRGPGNRAQRYSQALVRAAKPPPAFDILTSGGYPTTASN
jgi:outer membrane protein TolC